MLDKGQLEKLIEQAERSALTPAEHQRLLFLFMAFEWLDILQRFGFSFGWADLRNFLTFTESYVTTGEMPKFARPDMDDDDADWWKRN